MSLRYPHCFALFVSFHRLDIVEGCEGHDESQRWKISRENQSEGSHQAGSESIYTGYGQVDDKQVPENLPKYFFFMSEKKSLQVISTFSRYASVRKKEIERGKPQKIKKLGSRMKNEEENKSLRTCVSTRGLEAKFGGSFFLPSQRKKDIRESASTSLRERNFFLSLSLES